MAVDPAKKKAASLALVELPQVKTTADLITALNNRFRDYNTASKAILTSPAAPSTADKDNTWNLSYNRIANTGDPRDDLDVVNLRTLRKYISPQQVTQAEQPSSAPVATAPAYTIVFTKDGLVTDAEKSPSFTVNELRTGTFFTCSITADTAPSTEALKINFLVSVPGDTDDKKLFIDGSEIKLEIGAKGPVYLADFTITKTLPKGTKVRMLIVKAGLSEMVVGELVVKGEL